jgi:hypothetical protein
VECWPVCLGRLLFFFSSFISLAFSLNGNCGWRAIWRLAAYSHPGVFASGFSPFSIGRIDVTKCELYVVLLQLQICFHESVVLNVERRTPTVMDLNNRVALHSSYEHSTYLWHLHCVP